ncbi:hypothetical protein I5Q34_19815 [Streptomyces sp. AV19]|uniref:hypothetical protein n=1 Tax=Streptomyces sp. AV19 TaxID=2793068 RepID=UPI0018FE4C70|nr:hypothetical protein [Streptomyces sp. AV19]MBH1936496.1 hypothetical protein [Streptomyces sp. AV19]MDG4532553.1 hypothetical protein [Streptomyces sp. AV19]
MSFDRSPDLTVTEFRSLSGTVTTWSAPAQPRRLKLQWTTLDREDHEFLDRLVRRLDGPGPVALIDPLARNLLTGAQAAGTGSRSSWSANPQEITVYGGASPSDPVTVSVDAPPANGTTDLNWRGLGWPWVPVTPGMTLTWWAPGLLAAGADFAGLGLYWHNRTGDFLTGLLGNKNRPLVAVAPAGAAFVRVAARFNAKGAWPVGESILTVGDTSAALLAGDRPYGEGAPQYSVTGYTHAATSPNPTYRDITLELVEVASATG